MAKEEVIFVNADTPANFSSKVKNAMEEGYRIVPHTTFCVYENVAVTGNNYATRRSENGFFACEMVLDYFNVSSS